MFDGDRDLPVLTSGICVIKGRVVVASETMRTFLNVFLRIVQISKIHDFLHIFELMHTYSRTLPVS